VADNDHTSQPADVLPHVPDPKRIRDRVVDALRDAIIAIMRLGRNLRAVEGHEHIVRALRRRDPARVQRLRRAHLLPFYDNGAPVLTADRPANTCQGGLDQ